MGKNTMSTNLKNSVYAVSQESDYLTKKVRYENKVNGKLLIMPLFSPYIRSSFDLKILTKYISDYNYSHNLRGIVVPIDRADLLDKVPETMKNTSLVIIDTLPEVFYYGSLKKEIYQRYSKISGLPKEIVKLLQTPNNTQNWASKEDQYSEMIDSILLEDDVRVKLTTAVINAQLEKDVDIVIPFSPLILNDSVSFLATQRFYEQAQRLFLGTITDIDEELGKRIALPLFLHESILFNTKLINQIINYINTNEHASIVLKIYFSGNKNVKDLDFDQVINLSNLLKAIGIYSKFNSCPVHLLCDLSLGLISLMYGFDSYSQPFNDKQIETEGAPDITKLKLRNPTIDYGKIYSMDLRKKIYHKNYVAHIKYNKNILPCPANKYCNKHISGLDVLNMKRHTFWEHARLHNLESKNYEIDEILDSIREKTIRVFKSRFNNFFNQAILPN
ncbi:MAG: hypothetical protein ABH804_01620 [archaeon]